MLSLTYIRGKIFNSFDIIDDALLSFYIDRIKDFFKKHKDICIDIDIDIDIILYALDNIQNKIKCKNIPYEKIIRMEDDDRIKAIDEEYFVYANYIFRGIDLIEEVLKEKGVNF